MENHRQLMASIAIGICLAAVTETFGADSENPYRGIIERNVFDLKNKPPLEVRVEPKPLPPKVAVVGITTILTHKCAILKWPAGPGDPSRTRSFVMTEGQRVDEIEVLQIDEKSGSVKLNNHGVVQLVGIGD
jgi:hypothetical protein